MKGNIGLSKYWRIRFQTSCEQREYFSSSISFLNTSIVQFVPSAVAAASAMTSSRRYVLSKSGVTGYFIARAGLCLFCRHYARGRSLYKFVVPFFIVIITVIITHHCWEHMGEARTRQTIWTWKHHFSHSLLWVLWNLGDVRYFLTLWLGTAKCFGSRHRHSYSKCLDRSSKPSLAAASWKRWSPAPWKGTDNSETRISLFTAR